MKNKKEQSRPNSSTFHKKLKQEVMSSHCWFIKGFMKTLIRLLDESKNKEKHFQLIFKLNFELWQNSSQSGGFNTLIES